MNVSVSKFTVSQSRCRTWCWRTCRMEMSEWAAPSEVPSAMWTKVKPAPQLRVNVPKFFLFSPLISIFCFLCSQEHFSCAFPRPEPGAVSHPAGQRCIPQTAVAQLSPQCHFHPSASQRAPYPKPDHERRQTLLVPRHRPHRGS